MLKKDYCVIGVMSGTSLDGVDVVFASYSYSQNWTFEILKADTYPYPKDLKLVLKDLVYKSLDELVGIDEKYSAYLADIVKTFIRTNHISKIDFIASHGHTALHQPEKCLTYQIGNQQIFSDLLGLKVICDFRVQDVQMGGQGAPLVPIGDRYLFSDFQYCLNLGGFANISFENNKDRVAFDICPVNIVLNHYVSTLNMDFDNNGTLASIGKVHEGLLNRLNQLDFYKESPPKSLGLEWVEKNIFPIINTYHLEIADILRTYVEHIAMQICKVFADNSGSVLVSGGGVYHKFLIERLKHLSNVNIKIPTADIIEYKEALIFGFLGVLKDRGETNCLASVTGARGDHSSGKILIPKILF